MMFISPSKGEMDLDRVVIDILDYVSEDTELSYKLIVGSDSHNRENESCFVSAIIIHRMGKGARYYYCRHYEKKIKSLRQRIFYEASLSLDMADKLCQCLKKHGKDDINVEIHLDVGIQGESRELVKEVIGMVVGSGFDARIKPDACAASNVADRYTR